MPRLAAPLALLLAALAACAPAPREAWLGGTPAAAAPEPAGTNARGEACFARPAAPPALGRAARGATEILCTGWTQPAARLVELEARGELDALAADPAWRGGLEGRLACGPAEPTTLAGGIPARLIPCTRRQGGWPHLAIVAQGPRGTVLAEGLPAALPVIERRIAGLPPGGSLPRSAALAAAAQRLAAETHGAGDLGQLEALMTLGRELNQVEDFAAAAEAYRAALALQERVLGRTHPALAHALSSLALNLAAMGRGAEAAPLFARAATLAPGSPDLADPARLLHYRGMAALATGEPAEAERLLAAAAGAYAALVPPSLLAGGARDALLADPLAQTALLGLAEARRNRAVALARLGRAEEGAGEAAEARAILRRAGIEQPMLAGRALRTAGGAAQALGRPGEAAGLFQASATRFAAAGPGERPEAAAHLAAGRHLMETGRRAEALAAFRAGAALLGARGAGAPPALVAPYLEALEAERARDGADQPALAAEMFAAAQLARRPQTARLVGQAAARLAVAAGDPRIAEAVRRLQEAEREIRGLHAARDAAAVREAQAIDAEIARQEALRAEAEAEVAAAAPGYRQLLAAPADAAAIGRALGPGEVLVAMLVGERASWSFAVEPGGAVAARRVAMTEAEADALVRRIRAGLSARAMREGRPFDTAAAEALHAAFLAPLGIAEGRQLVVAADGPLLGIPFGLLLTGPADPARLADAPWLVRRHAVAHMPSAQTLVMLRSGAGASAAPRPYAGLGDPVAPSAAQLAASFPAGRCAADAGIAAALPALPGTRAEVSVARRLLGGEAGAARFGAEFTAEAVLGGGLGGARIVHLATHALLPGELSCLAEPALMVSPPRGAADAAGAFIPASTLLGLRLDADLVILSACNTGTTPGGAGAGGEGLAGLARAFFFAGTRGLLATHWAVDDLAAALLVTGTLERERAGANAAVALQGASLRVIGEAGRRLPAAYAHPFHWAPFALIGDGRRPAPARLAAAGAF